MRFSIFAVLLLSLSFLPLVNSASIAALPVASNFKLQDTRQDTVELSNYIGNQPVILYFWASWNAGSGDDLRTLNSSYGNFHYDGVEFFAINVGESPDDVVNFISPYNLAYQVLLDKISSVTYAYHAEVPSFVIINKKGEIVFKDSYFPYANYKELLLEGSQTVETDK